MELFDKTKIKSLKMNNRIGIAPMCTTMVHKKDGVATDFHYGHYMTLALGKPAFITQEATAIAPEGMIKAEDLGIYTKTQQESLKHLVSLVHQFNVPIGIQISHAGRKAVDSEVVFAPSSIAFSDAYKIPHALTSNQIKDLINQFKLAAKAADEIGYDFIEIHGAHGYLINQFLSPLTNERDDEYGKDRTLFLKQIVDACKEVCDLPIFVRLSVEDYHEEGLSVQDYIPIVHLLESLGVDLVSVSTGGVVSQVPYHVGPMYQAPYSKVLKDHCKIPISVAGLIHTYEDMKKTIHEGMADYVLVARLALRSPFFLLDYLKQNDSTQFEDLPNYIKRGF